MDFISNIWKTTVKREDAAAPPSESAAAADTAPPDPSSEPAADHLAPEDAQTAAAGTTKPSRVSRSSSGSTSGPDDEAPDTPDPLKADSTGGEAAAGDATGTGVVGSAASSIAGVVDIEGVSQVSHKAIESAKSASKTFGSFLYSVANKAGQTVSATAKQLKHTVEHNTILADFNKEQENFVKSKQGQQTEAVPPWVGCEDEEAVKQQILSLSADKRNFVRSPPSGVQFEFDSETMFPVAMALLQEDPNLQKMRFELVPKLINEETFWRNYFYRVSLIKQSTQLSSLAHDKGSSSDGSGWSSSKSSSQESTKDNEKDDAEGAQDSPSHEFVSDAYQSSQISKEDIKTGMKQLGMEDRVKNDDEWEQELQKELQDYEVVAEGSNVGDDAEWEKEIQQMLEAEKMQAATK